MLLFARRDIASTVVVALVAARTGLGLSTPPLVVTRALCRGRATMRLSSSTDGEVATTKEEPPSGGATPIQTSTKSSHALQQPATKTTPPAKKSLGDWDGPRISNFDTIFDEIDQALGVNKPPDIEVILTDHLSHIVNPFSKFMHLYLVRFGHLAIRYTVNSTSYLMNIVGDFSNPNSKMINFCTPADYFYGTNGFASFSQQGGVYNRPFVSVRVERAAHGATEALHAYFQALQKASEIGAGSDTIGSPPGSSDRGAVRFQLVEVNLSKIARMMPAPLDKVLYKMTDFFRSTDDARKAQAAAATQEESSTPSVLPQGMQDSMGAVQDTVKDIRNAIYNSGNCAQWSSSGLEFAGLIRRPRLFPKAVLTDLLEEEYVTYNRPNNVHVVYYNEVEHATKLDLDYKYLQSAKVHPLKPIRNAFYNDMEQFASVVVTVPSGTNTAVVQKKTPARKPGSWLHLLDGVVVYVPAAIMAGLIDHVGPIGPATAALWLFAMWWLY